MMQKIGEIRWEEAFAAYALDAATGRLFRGLAHNINGVAQAFSMQTELLRMMFTQADGLLYQIENSANLEDASENSQKLKALLERRASLVVHLEREVQVVQKVMHRCSGLTPATSGTADLQPFSLRSVIETELEFMNGDVFFKHKVKKELSMPAVLPPLEVGMVELHLIVAVLLENAAQSMQAAHSTGQSQMCLLIDASVTADGIALQVSDTGEGISAESLAKIFEPFYTTRPDHLGIGLWLAAKLAGRFGWVLSCDSTPGHTTFTLAIPCHGDSNGGH